MGTIDATCSGCGATMRWLTGSLQLCGSCRAMAQPSRRYVNVQCDVWDTAWSDPVAGTWTSGLKREQCVTRYPSIQAAYEAAESLNANTNPRLERFRAACEAAVAENEAAKPLDAWVEGIEGLDTL